MTLSAAAPEETTVFYTLGGGTATSGTDYTAPSPSSVTFDAGETTQTIEVAIADDGTAEGDETFMVTLPAAPASQGYTAATGAGASHTVTISDNTALRLSFDGAATRSVGEGAGTLELPVTLSGTPAAAVSVTVTAASGTATRPQDYTVAGDADGDGEITVSFAAGASGDDLTQTVTINIVDDNVVDAGV